MKVIMDKAVEIINNFDGVEEIEIWKSKDGNFYLMIYFSVNEQTKEAKVKLFKYDADKGQFEFCKEKNW